MWGEQSRRPTLSKLRAASGLKPPEAPIALRAGCSTASMRHMRATPCWFSSCRKGSGRLVSCPGEQHRHSCWQKITLQVSPGLLLRAVASCLQSSMTLHDLQHGLPALSRAQASTKQQGLDSML